MNCKLPRVILETNELYRRLSLWVTACIKHERFDLDSILPGHMQMTSITIVCNTASLLRTCKTQYFIVDDVLCFVCTVPTFRRNVNTKLRGVTSQESMILISPWACRVCVQRHFYVWQLSPRFTQTFSHDGRQHVVHRYSSLPWVGINVFSSVCCSEYQVFSHRCWKCFPSARRRVEYQSNVG